MVFNFLLNSSQNQIYTLQSQKVKCQNKKNLEKSSLINFTTKMIIQWNKAHEVMLPHNQPLTNQKIFQKPYKTFSITFKANVR